MDRYIALGNERKRDRRGDALIALRDTARYHRVAIEMLLADAPKQPKPDSG